VFSAKIVPNMPVVRIDAAGWYQRADFIAALESGSVATWHTPGHEPGDLSDAFVTYDHGEGSNMCGPPELGCLPDDIWEDICQQMKELGVEQAILWITNL
jgi:hypothetical protein